MAILGSTPDHEGPAKIDIRLGDADEIALKAISTAWSRPEKPMEGFSGPTTEATNYSYFDASIFDGNAARPRYCPHDGQAW